MPRSLSNLMPPIARVYIVRHGETDANRTHIIQGQLNTTLNEAGIEQARLLSKALESIPFDIAYTSDLDRAAKTADIILGRHPGVQLVKQAELREKFMGLLQGQRWSRGMTTETDETIEKDSEFKARAIAWWNKSILDYTALLPHRKAEHYRILVVSHGGFINTLVKTLIRKKGYKCAKGIVIWECLNSSVAIIEIGEDGEGVVVQYGDVSHLQGRNGVETNADVQ